MVDNIGAIFIAENAVTKRTKHIDTRYHVIREYVSDGIVELKFVRSIDNVADIFTKILSAEQFLYLRDKLLSLPTDPIPYAVLNILKYIRRGNREMGSADGPPFR